jgi:hypothetical protein
LIVGEEHRLSKLDKTKLAELALIVVALGGEQDGAINAFISERGSAKRSERYDRAALERALAESGRPPRVVVSLPHSLALPALLEGTGLAGSNNPSTVSEGVREQACHHDIRVMRLLLSKYGRFGTNGLTAILRTNGCMRYSDALLSITESDSRR